MKENKLKDLVCLYEKLLAHLDELAGLTRSQEDVLKNAKQIKALNEAHVETRDFARNLLTHDFTQETKNPFNILSISFYRTLYQPYRYVLQEECLYSCYNQRHPLYIRSRGLLFGHLCPSID